MRSASIVSQFIGILIVIGIVISIAWGCTLIGKYLSYKFFYEAQVKDTVREVLREEGIK